MNLGIIALVIGMIVLAGVVVMAISNSSTGADNTAGKLCDCGCGMKDCKCSGEQGACAGGCSAQKCGCGK
ncbi:MAG: hypothetical protein KKB21_00595 [Nanoarchaeota archaeon]|nr:hypothetical protein [Nanoarchaeota archaeon]MBU4086053.1 hypothetical protein [Nanoarchaeota archaeon]